MRAVAAAERAGVRAVALVASEFERQARAIGRGVGLPAIRIAVYPGVPLIDSSDELGRKVKERMVPAIVEHLTEDAGGARTAVDDEYDARRIVVAGDLDVVQESFDQRGWTDGLPIVPPTLARVERALTFTDREPFESIAVVPPSNRVVTPWAVAVNGVMSGCPPELLPFLLAIAEAVTDPQFHMMDAGATPGWEPLVLVSGPDLARHGFHSGSGVMRIGARTNTTVGRFLRMFMRNVAGLRTPPTGDSDKACFGLNFNVALAEDDEQIARIGWPSLREEAGFARHDTVVGVQSVVGISTPIYSSGTEASDHLRLIAEHIAGASAHWASIGVLYNSWWPLLAMSASIAGTLASNGLSKDDVRREVAARATVPLKLMRSYPPHVGASKTYWDERLPLLHDPGRYADRSDDAAVSSVVNPATLGIVVAGDPGRNQSRLFVNSHLHGQRVFRRVQFR